METYGIQITAYRNNSHGWSERREFEASDRAAALAAGRAWLLVEGCDTNRSTVEVIADGVTFREHMKRELLNMAARMSLRHGVSVDGPHAWEDGNGWHAAVVRLWLDNGRGVSVSSKLTDGYLIRSEYAGIREDAGDQHGWTFDADMEPYSGRTAVGEQWDQDISGMLATLSTLPRK